MHTMRHVPCMSTSCAPYTMQHSTFATSMIDHLHHHFTLEIMSVVSFKNVARPSNVVLPLIIATGRSPNPNKVSARIKRLSACLCAVSQHQNAQTRHKLVAWFQTQLMHMQIIVFVLEHVVAEHVANS